MVKQAGHLRIGLRLLSGTLLALAGLGFASPPPAAHTPRTAQGAGAAPQSGGAFTVTSTADDNTSDPSLSLREALLVARGGTGLTGLARPASAGEQAALAGCSFTAGLITGLCGPGFANSIVFTGSLGVDPVITLTLALPDVSNTATTTIDGSVNGVFPIISATGLLAGTDALLVASNNNALSGLTITGAPHDDLRINGDSNQILTGTVLLAASRYGLLVDGGKFNVINSALIGTSSPVVGACGQGNQQGGIVLANGAATNMVQLATVACNSGFGVRFDGVGTTLNTLSLTTVISQTGNGLEIVNGTQSSKIFSNTITNNSQNGILISGASTNANNIFLGNFIGITANGAAAGNGQYGVRLSAGAHDNSIATGCETGQPCQPPNVISGNALGGVRFDTGATGNILNGVMVGLNQAGTAAVPNGGPGVDVDNAPVTLIGSLISVAFNTIAGNVGPGVRFSNTDGGAVGFFNTIGVAGLGNGGPGVELINTSNTGVRAATIRNNGGAGVAIEGNASTGDFVAPTFVGQNGGLPIDLGNDGHTPNGAHAPPGPNHWLNYPVINGASGSVITGTACVNCTVLIYIAISNPAAPGGGALQWQATIADGSGHWSTTLTGGVHAGDVTLLACTSPCNYAAFDGLSHSDGSELSPRLQLWLPLVRR